MSDTQDDNQVQQPGQPTDISRQSTRLARLIDRLEPGDYTIELAKDYPNAPWKAIISSAGETIRVIDLMR
jgi:hypothetical protein